LHLTRYAVVDGSGGVHERSGYFTLIFLIRKLCDQSSALLALNHDCSLARLDSHRHDLGFGNRYSGVKLLLGVELHGAGGA
jgi:hypothetical protein